MPDWSHFLLSLFLFGLGLEVLAVLFVMGWVLRRRLRHRSGGSVFSPVDDDEEERGR
jgi:hypothetical protein